MGMKSAILVDVTYLALLEHLPDEVGQVRQSESEVLARRHLRLAIEVADEVSDLLAV